MKAMKKKVQDITDGDVIIIKRKFYVVDDTNGGEKEEFKHLYEKDPLMDVKPEHYWYSFYLEQTHQVDLFKEFESDGYNYNDELVFVGNCADLGLLSSDKEIAASMKKVFSNP
jgi:hypothetical protein